MTLFKQLGVLLPALAVSMAVLAQEDSIDIFVQNVMKQRKIPGLQIAIVQQGKIIKKGNYGLSNVQDSVPVSDRTVFPINSITKAFAGVAIMQLVEAGKINLTAPISSYLNDLPEAWKSVNIQQLLSHTSGIPNIVDEEESVLIAPTPELAWQKIVATPNEFKAGEKFSYNQTNYVLLGKIIDKYSGSHFTSFITKEQLQKVGMPNTIRAGFGASKEVIAHAASGYRLSRGKLINMFFSFPPFLQTAAGMSSTATEIAQWIISLQSFQLLKTPASLTALWKPAFLDNGKTAGFNSLLNGYAAGWPIVARAEHRAAAAVGGGRSAVFVYPEDDLSIVVLTNLAGGSPEGFIDELAGFYIPAMKESNGFGLSPAVRELRLKLEKTSYKNVIELVKKGDRVNGGSLLSETDVNTWGYRLLKENRLPEAIEIFKLNVFLYPKSANVFDSMGEVYAETGDIAMAIANYEQSLKLDPQNKNAEDQLLKLKQKK